MLPAVRNFDRIAFHPSVTYFVGENGSGKSTLMEGLAVVAGMNPEGGGRNFTFSTHATHSPLGDALRLSWGVRRPRDMFFLRAESFYNVASAIDDLDNDPDIDPRIPKIVEGYGGVSPHKLSHGESFFALFEKRFLGNGLYFLDEPESALSPKRQLEFLAILHRYCQLGGQFVVATHSPILMSYPDSLLYEFTPQGCARPATRTPITVWFRVVSSRTRAARSKNCWGRWTDGRRRPMAERVAMLERCEARTDHRHGPIHHASDPIGLLTTPCVSSPLLRCPVSIPAHAPTGTPPRNPTPANRCARCPN